MPEASGERLGWELCEAFCEVEVMSSDGLNIRFKNLETLPPLARSLPPPPPDFLDPGLRNIV